MISDDARGNDGFKVIVLECPGGLKDFGVMIEAVEFVHARRRSAE